MKVFGGNGQRVNGQNNSSQRSTQSKPANAGKSNINNENYGNNNAGSARRGATPPQKPKKKGKGVLIALLIILVLFGAAYTYWQVTTAPPDISNPSDNNQNAAPEATPVLTDTETREIGRYYTVLVVGIDQLQANTDTIMVVRYDAVENKANLVSIPRDTLVNVPQSVKKINAVYSNAESNSESGIDALLDEVEEICGFRPDSYVFINTDVFMQAIDCLGGVFFDVPVSMNYDDVTPNINYEFHIHIDKGYQLLNGENALGVFRFRKNNDGSGYPMGDIDRLDTQHALIKATAQQALQLKNATKLIEIAQIVIDNAETNLTIGNMQWYAKEFLKMSMDDINIMTLPGNYSCVVRNGSYVSINVDEWLVMVNQFLNPLKQPITSENCGIICQIAPDVNSYSLDANNYYVTNGTNIAGGVKSFYQFG